MNRRQFLTTAATSALAMGLPKSARAERGPGNSKLGTKRLNILFIMVDDLNVALGCYDHPAVQTPNINRLAARGTRFSQAYCPYPLCGPSRSALLTGQRPESFPMANNEVCWRDLRPDLHTLPELARAVGYHTERIGKIFHHGISKANPVDWRAEGFPLPHTHTDPQSWVKEWGDSYNVYEAHATGPEQLIDGRPHGGTSLHTMRVTNPEVLPDTLAADRAIAFLQNWSTEEPLRSSKSEGGFFLGIGFNKPHVPLIAPEKWWAFYDSLPDAEIDALMGPTAQTPADLPPGTLKQNRFHRDASPEQRRHLYRGYLASVSHMDEQLGRVLDALDAHGLTDSTLICFVADHGYHIGQQGQWDKMMLLEPALQIPLILAGPGIASGKVCPAIVESLDLFPTLRSLLGLPATQATAGTDLTPWLANPALPSDRPAFAWVKAGPREGWTVRTATHRYGEMSLNGAPPQPYLFDLTNDPHETTNLANRPEHAALQTALAARIHAHFPSQLF